MKKTKRIIAGLSALTLAMGLTACGGGPNDSGSSNNGGGGGDAAAPATEAPATETTPAKTLSEEEEAQLEGAGELVADTELENKVVKWLAHYDVNPQDGAPMSGQLSLFQTKYGAEVKWYPTTWATRYSDLSTYLLGGEGIDLFPRDDEALPKGVISGMFSPVDDYIDMNSDLWKDVAVAMETFNFGGKHYSFVTGVSANGCVYYNKQTIEEYGFDDPWELYEEGKWNWDTFTNMLQEFCEANDDNCGLDGWWSELALYRSGGVPFIETKDGEIVVNLMSPEIEKAQNFMFDLYNKGLVMDKSLYDWAEQPQFMGEGRELFFICGLWHIQGVPENWSTQIPPENLGVVTVPNAPDADHPWQDAVMDGYCLVKGAANPEGAALYAECGLAAGKDEDAKALREKQEREEFGFTDEVIAHRQEINELARQYPVVDIAGGMSADIEALTTSNQNKSVGLNASLHGVEWSQTRDELAATLEVLVDEVRENLKNAQ